MVVSSVGRKVGKVENYNRKYCYVYIERSQWKGATVRILVGIVGTMTNLKKAHIQCLVNLTTRSEHF